MAKQPPITLQIDYRPTKSLIPYARNARTHSEAQIKQLMGLIKEYGWTNPIIVDEDNGVVAGHGRLLAADRLGLTKVPCIERADWSEAQKRGYVIADNKSALNAEWDMELLELEMRDLLSMDFDLELTAFTSGESDYILNGWDSDLDTTENTTAHDLDMPGRIVISCAQADKTDVADAIRDLIEEHGWEGVTLDS